MNEPSRPRRSRKLTKSQGLILFQVMTLIMLGIVEITFRWIGYDFDQLSDALTKAAPCYRQPTEPIGEAYWRRRGPEIYRGDAVYGHFGMKDGFDESFETVVEYDDLGFRNPPGLSDWEAVVVGDSFVESGYLGYRDIFTTRCAELSGLRIKNLGVSQTGPLTHICYLKEWGKAASTKHAVLVFFEGNDLDDLIREEAELLRERTVKRTRSSKLSELVKQTSFLKGVYRAFANLAQKKSGSAPKLAWTNAHYTTPQGQKTPVWICYAPPDPKEMSNGLKESLRSAIQQWSQTARDLGLTPWILYLPCKERALHNRLEFTNDTESYLKQWKPNDLPQLIQASCEQNQVRFINACPALQSMADQGASPFNSWDTHLSRAGSTRVGQILADALTADR